MFLAQQILHSNFLRRVAVLVGGTSISQIIVILLSPVLTRLFSPDDFGNLAVFTSLVLFGAVLSTLKYEMAIPNNKTEKMIIATLMVSFFLLIFFSLLTVSIACGLTLFTHEINFVRDGYIWLVILGVIISSFYQILYYFALAKGNFSRMSQSAVAFSAGAAFFQVAAGLLSFNGFGLIWGMIAGRAMGVVLLVKDIIKKCYFLSSKKRVIIAAKRHYGFPRFMALASVINIIGMQATPLIFLSLFDAATAGFIALTLRILSAPSMLIGQAIGKVFYKEACDIVGKKNLTKSLILKLSSLLLWISFPVFYIFGLFGKDLFSYIFGSDWSQAGIYAQYLAPWILLSFVSSPLSHFALVKSKQKTSLYITVYETTIRLGALLLGGYYGGALTAVIGYSLMGCIISFVYICWVFRLASCKLSDFFDINKKILVYYLFLSVACLSLQLVESKFLQLSLAVILVLGFYLFSFRTVLRYLVPKNDAHLNSSI